MNLGLRVVDMQENDFGPSYCKLRLRVVDMQEDRKMNFMT